MVLISGKWKIVNKFEQFIRTPHCSKCYRVTYTKTEWNMNEPPKDYKSSFSVLAFYSFTQIMGSITIHIRKYLRLHERGEIGFDHLFSFSNSYEFSAYCTEFSLLTQLQFVRLLLPSMKMSLLNMVRNRMERSFYFRKMREWSQNNSQSIYPEAEQHINSTVLWRTSYST